MRITYAKFRIIKMLLFRQARCLRYLYIPFIFALLSSVDSQALTIEPSVYVGMGTGTNIGGAVGIGSEVIFYDKLSFNAAVGSLHPVLDVETEFSKFDFDFGIKVYPIKYLYLGVNYGLIDYEYIKCEVYDPYVSSILQAIVYQQKTRGFSFTVGLRTPEYKHLYLSGFFGTTNNQDANSSDAHGFLNEPVWMPRIGIFLGYNITYLLSHK